jgi:hypothetical protein
MARSQPNPALRARIELAIKVISPMLDVLLATGERASRLLSSQERDPRPHRLTTHGEHAPRGLPPRGSRSART